MKTILTLNELSPSRIAFYAAMVSENPLAQSLSEPEKAEQFRGELLRIANETSQNFINRYFQRGGGFSHSPIANGAWATDYLPARA